MDTKSDSIKPITTENQDLRAIIYENINNIRSNNGLGELEFLDIGEAQRHSQIVLEKGEIVYRNDLPVKAGETVLYSYYYRESVDLVVINELMRELTGVEENRRLLLNDEFIGVDVGVSFTDTETSLVLDYYSKIS
ncbi:hypothetical protein GF326_04630 [Candidatus Bathyarchaeota archaeon]|nr:hypothetical protein [Candidatus Bathyarchaeota archaeon]